MKAIVAGSTGMVGNLVLNICLNSEKIDEVRSLVRESTRNENHKLKETVINNFEDYSEYSAIFKNIDVAFFCIGAYTGQVSDELFKKITVDYAVQFANALKQYSPEATICLLSGAGADRSEKSKTSFARYKGMAENQISKLSMKFYTFRPAYIYPTIPRKEPNAMYKIFKYLYPVFKLLGDDYSIQSSDLAQAIFNVGIYGAEKEILENRDILNYVSMQK